MAVTPNEHHVMHIRNIHQLCSFVPLSVIIIEDKIAMISATMAIITNNTNVHTCFAAIGLHENIVRLSVIRAGDNDIYNHCDYEQRDTHT